MAPKRVDQAAKREEILHAAVRVFARRGFAATRIDDVAAEAGIAKGSVYLYFDSRDSLLEAAFSAYATGAAAALAEAVAAGGPPLDRLAALVRSAVATIVAEPDLARVLLDLWSTKAPIDLAGLYVEYRAAIAGLLREAGEQGVIRPGIGPEHAVVIVGAIEGCVLQWLLDPALSLPDAADRVVEMCVDGVRA